MNRYCFLHLSDIHFGQERHGNIAIHEDVRVELKNDCEVLCKSIGPADGIIVTGDIAFSGKPEQYRVAGSWLEELTQKVGCAKTAVSVIPGNHDVDLDRIGTACKVIQKELRAVSLEELDGLLQSLGEDGLESNPLLPKLSAYREFASRYGCDFIPDKDRPERVYPLWRKYLRLEDPNMLLLVGLTSVLVSDKSDALGTMVLGNQQYIINREESTCHIVMMHHPLEWFRDCDHINAYLRRARVVFCGHEHKLNAHEDIHEGGKTLWVHAGSTNSPEGREPYQYRYNWVIFTLHDHDNYPCLQVTIYPRVWDLEYPRFIPDTHLSLGEDSVTYHLTCPELRIRVHKMEATNIHDEQKKTPVNSGEVEESMKDDEPFSKLRYLFWKYLDWSERLKVLADLDILPTDLDQPFPQIMERLALDIARDEGKLHQLWEAIMPFVPEDQKGPNPF